MAEAAKLLQTGELVAFPTETVYGLGANALDAQAVRRIFAAKGRPAADPLIVHVTSLQAMEALTTLPLEALAPLSHFWPGPLTVVVPRRPVVPLEVTAGLESVALRIPAHPVARALIDAAGCPIAAPSANTFTRPSPTRAAHVLQDLGGRIALILDGGDTWHGLESTVIDLTASPPTLLRPGALTVEVLRQALPNLVLPAPRFEALPEASPSEKDTSEKELSSLGPAASVQWLGLKSPGTHLKHYSPRAPVSLFQGEKSAVLARLRQEVQTYQARGLRVGVMLLDEWLEALQDLPCECASLGSSLVLEQAAQRLFGGFRWLDGRGVEVILTALFPEEGLGRTLNDRLMRAAEGRVLRV